LNKAVFLDRDGVLNEAIVRDGMPYSPETLSEFVIVPDAKASLEMLRDNGFRLIVVTNQPDIARGKMTRQAVDAMNAHLMRELPLDDVEVCPHDNADACDCRKPQPGMLLRAAQRYGVELGRSFMVGDRWRDIEAGRRAGCSTILIGDGYAEGIKSKPDAQVATLTEAANWIISATNRSRGRT
jgi:D-glycero-D-manno-heptose 1,7-bisphosphate phosphatase